MRVGSTSALRGLVTLAILLPVVLADDAVPQAGPRAFESPEALVDAMVEASRANDDAALTAIVGRDGTELIQTGADPSVARTRAEFAKNAETFLKLRDNEDGTKTLIVGDGRWPLPVPLRRYEDGWKLDIEAGRLEMRVRRIGQNELDAIRLARLYAEAQEEYKAKDRDGDGVREYAQRVRSTPGQRDGLYWPTGEDGEKSPFGPLVASIRPYLESTTPTDPVGGYHWKVLKAQGSNAPGGAHPYVLNDNMIAGFALMGVPAQYGETGVMTFLVSHHGDVYEKDIGACTKRWASLNELYNPTDGWRRVED